MADAKIEIKVGAVSFSGEGEGSWLSEQLDKILEKLPVLANLQPAVDDDDDPVEDPPRTGSGSGGAGTLAAYLKGKNATANKTRKFLATALWLTDVKDQDRLRTNDITKALSDAKQGSLGNPAQCLINNISQGFCHKEGKLFYVTPEGRTDIG